MPQSPCFLSSGNFTGPFDLLLELAERQNVNLNHVSLSAIASDYLKLVLEGRVRSRELAEFIKMASRLIFIKSGALSSVLIDKEDETKEELLDLKEKLVLFSLFKKKAYYLKSRLGQNSSFSKQGNYSFISNASNQLEKTKMALIIKRLIGEIPEAKDQKMSRRVFRLEIKNIMAKISRIFEKEKKLSFFDFSKNMDKIEVAVTFLALLEIARKMETNLSQKKWTDDICLEN